MIRRGQKKDIATILEMVSDTIEIMKEEHNDQWDEVYPTEVVFEKDVQNGSLYVLEEEGRVVGSITVDQNEPVEYERILWEKKGPAYTFHRLVVNPHERGKGVAQKLIAYAEEVAIHNQVPYMKIDTYSLNKKAQNLFGKSGYKKAGEMEFQGKTHPFYCYEKILASKS